MRLVAAQGLPKFEAEPGARRLRAPGRRSENARRPLRAFARAVSGARRCTDGSGAAAAAGDARRAAGGRLRPAVWARASRSTSRSRTRPAAACSSRDYFGRKPVVLSLVYYDCPMLCTVSLNGLASALEVLSFVPGQEFEVADDQLRCPGDAGARRRQEEGLHGALHAAAARTPGWHFLTGERRVDRGAHPRRRLPLRLGRADQAVRAPRGRRRPDPRGEDLPLPVRRRVRAEGPAAGARRGGFGPIATPARPAPALLLQLRPRRPAATAPRIMNIAAPARGADRRSPSAPSSSDWRAPEAPPARRAAADRNT